MESTQLEEFAAKTGFDPRQDLLELLVVSNGAPGVANSLVLASGVFNSATIATAAQAAGATSETYQGVTILDSPGKTEGVAFLNGSIMIAGSIANVKAAIERQTIPATLPAALVTQANQLSVTQDAWAISTVSPAALIPAGAQKSPPIGGMAVPANVLQQVLSGYAGVKFGSNVALTRAGAKRYAGECGWPLRLAATGRQYCADAGREESGCCGVREIADRDNDWDHC